jgi:hypothetical protein
LRYGRLPGTDGTDAEASTARLRRGRALLTVAERRLIEDPEIRGRFTQIKPYERPGRSQWRPLSGYGVVESEFRYIRSLTRGVLVGL